MQHPNGSTQGSSSSSPNPDLEAMKSAHTAAITSNERTFPVFAKKLASGDIREYVTTARKLTAWLSSEKAYYPAARPKIVELLEIALSTFADTFVHHSAAADLAELLRQLAQAVIPFIHLFPETELQSRLQQIIVDIEQSLSGISRSPTHDNVPPPGAITTNIPSHTIASTVNARPQSTVPPTPGPQMFMSQIRPLLVPRIVDAVTDGLVHADAPRERNSTEIAPSQTDANPLVSPVMNTPQEISENISLLVPSKPQPKRARRAELSEELIARDLDWFKSNQAVAVVKEDPGASPSSRGGGSSLASASDTAHIPARSPSLKKKTARMVPSRRLPRRTLDIARESESGPSAFGLPPPSEIPADETTSFEDSPVQNIDERQSSLEKTVSGDRRAAVSEARGMQVVSPHKDLPSPEPQLVVTSSSGPPIKLEIPQTDSRFPPVKPSLLNGESAIPPCLSTPGVESMDISASGSEGVMSEPPRESESTPLQSPEVVQLCSPILPPPVNAWEPPLNLNFNLSQISPGQLQQSAMDMNQRRFDGEMTIIHSTQGKPFTHTHVIDISLNDNVFAKVSKWINRKSHLSEAPHGVCISLACYRLPEVFDKIRSGSDRPDVEALTSQSPCSWPYSNRLSLHINGETRQTIITLSPPFFLTPDQCVDVSSLMKPGINTLEIRQQGDLSEYLVVLHAHRPTRVQLAELDVIKTVDERWKRYLDALSARVIPGKMLSTTPAGAVGVF